MELFIIACLTTALVIAIIKTRQKRIKMRRITFRQSILHQVVKHMMPTNAEYKRDNTKRQSVERSRERVVRVIKTPDSKAYWVKDNIFYCAEVIDGEFDPQEALPVDTTYLSKREVDKLLHILDNLKNG